MVTFWIYFEELTGSAEGLDMREVRDIGESRTSKRTSKRIMFSFTKPVQTG